MNWKNYLATATIAAAALVPYSGDVRAAESLSANTLERRINEGALVKFNVEDRTNGKPAKAVLIDDYHDISQAVDIYADLAEKLKNEGYNTFALEGYPYLPNDSFEKAIEWNKDMHERLGKSTGLERMSTIEQDLSQTYIYRYLLGNPGIKKVGLENTDSMTSASTYTAFFTLYSSIVENMSGVFDSDNGKWKASPKAKQDISGMMKRIAAFDPLKKIASPPEDVLDDLFKFSNYCRSVNQEYSGAILTDERSRIAGGNLLDYLQSHDKVGILFGAAHNNDIGAILEKGNVPYFRISLPMRDFIKDMQKNQPRSAEEVIGDAKKDKLF